MSREKDLCVRGVAQSSEKREFSQETKHHAVVPPRRGRPFSWKRREGPFSETLNNRIEISGLSHLAYLSRR